MKNVSVYRVIAKCHISSRKGTNVLFTKTFFPGEILLYIGPTHLAGDIYYDQHVYLSQCGDFLFTKKHPLKEPWIDFFKKMK